MSERNRLSVEDLAAIKPYDLALARHYSGNAYFEAVLRVTLAELMPSRSEAMALADQFLQAIRS